MVRPTSHVFAHRGSTTSSHTRARWQPYNANTQSSQPRTPSYLPTPASSVSSNSPSPPHLYGDRPRHVLPLSRECQLREAQKSRYALSLVGEFPSHIYRIKHRLRFTLQDQTVKSLCEIWRPQDIPPVFLTSCRPAIPTHIILSNPPLYSPPSSSSYPSPLPSPKSSCPEVVVCAQPPTIQPSKCDLASMRSFVQEVLRRSRTSGSVLQTALCYVEAIRAKIPELICRDKAGPSTATQAQAQDQNGAISTTLDGFESSSDNVALSDGLLATVRIDHTEHEAIDFFSEPRVDEDNVMVQKVNNSTPLPPLPPLPSPLLCPRRAFLASLILASKFMQDKCYSNRAWAKLSGLPPREIGRCERALGEALEWRLWVGKLPAAQSTSGRSLAKCRSESDVITGKPILQTFTNMAAVTPFPRLASQLKRHATYPIAGSCQEPPLAFFPTAMSKMAQHEISADSPSTCTTSPSTPGLSFSPTPTESSLGDRTVQISSFMDIPTPPPPGQFAPFLGTQNDKTLLALNGPWTYSTSRDNFQMPAVESRDHFPNMAPLFIDAPFSVSPPSLYM